MNWSVRVINETGKYMVTCSENCPCMSGCGPVMTGLCLPQTVCRWGGLGSSGGHFLVFKAL